SEKQAEADRYAEDQVGTHLLPLLRNRRERAAVKRPHPRMLIDWSHADRARLWSATDVDGIIRWNARHPTPNRVTVDRHQGRSCEEGVATPELGTGYLIHAQDCTTAMYSGAQA